MRLFSLYGWVRARYEAKLRRSNFVSAPWAGGVVLLVCVVVAMLLANLPWTAHYYHEFLGSFAERVGQLDFPGGDDCRKVDQ